MLLDHPAIIATDRAWGRFVRLVGGASWSRPGAAEASPSSTVGNSPWSAVEWERDLAALASAPVEFAIGGEPDDPGDVPPIAGETDPAEADSAGNADDAGKRRAGAAILRAIMLARQRRFAESEAAFAEAAERDPDLDLARVPAFWELERGGQDAAVRALDAIGRRRDAMVLRARVENRYRPRLVRSA